MFIRAKSNEPEGHYHIGYIRPDETGITSISEGHVHDIAMIAQQPQQNQLPQQQAQQFQGPTQQEPQPQQPRLTIIPARDGHTHEIEEFFGSKIIKEETLSDDEEVEKCKKMYEYAIALDEDSDSLSKAQESEDFYKGNQWDEKDKRKLKKEKRACLTLNQIKPKCDLLQGYYSRNKTDIKIIAEENGDQTAADILNHYIKKILTKSKWDNKEFRIVGDVIRVGRGIAVVNLGLDDRGTLNIEVDSRPWNMAFFGPHVEPDGSDLNYAGIFTDKTKEELACLYPDKVEELTEYLDPNPIADTSPVSRNDPYDSDSGVSNSSIIKRGAKKIYRLTETQYKKYRQEQVALNTKHSFYYSLETLTKEEIKHVKTIKDLSLINYSPYDVYVTVYAGNVLLKHEKSMLPEIGVLPFYCNRIGNYWWGKVQDGKDSQLEHNKHRSSMVDIVSKSGMYGVGVSQSAFQRSVDYDNFKAEKNNPGFTFLFGDNFKEHIHEFQGIRFPNEVGNIAKLSEDSVYSTMGINPQMMGISEQSQESGTAMIAKQKQGFLGNDFITENMSTSKIRLGSLLIKAIQAIETPERLLRLMENQDNRTLSGNPQSSLYPKKTDEELISIGVQRGIIPKEVVMQMQQQQQGIPPQIKPLLVEIQKGADKELRAKLLTFLNNFEIQDYDVTISESTWSPNAKFANYILLSELFKGNPNAPMEILVQEMPGLEQKTKEQIIKLIIEQRQAQQQLEQQKLQTQLQNTIIAHQQDNKDKQQTGTSSKSSQ